MTDAALPFLVCEDGTEYTERFRRMLGGSFRFARAGHLDEALDQARAGALGLLLDLDFRRTAAEMLVDEAGARRVARPEEERRRLASVQGILILRCLRSAGITLPALLFADLDDASQVSFLERDLSPLTVVSSDVGLAAIARILAAMAEAGRKTVG